jgi:hypothetical protein
MIEAEDEGRLGPIVAFVFGVHPDVNEHTVKESGVTHNVLDRVKPLDSFDVLEGCSILGGVDVAVDVGIVIEARGDVRDLAEEGEVGVDNLNLTGLD